MNGPRLKSEDLQPYIEFMLSQLRKADSFWFLRVENTFGYDAAIKMNQEVWHTMGKVTAREIKERFSIEEKGIEALAGFFTYFPWAHITGYEIEIKEQEILVSVPHCPSQEARLRQGLGEYDCREMHLLFFRSITEELDPNLTVECLFAPPDCHPQELFCKWRFMAGENKA